MAKKMIAFRLPQATIGKLRRIACRHSVTMTLVLIRMVDEAKSPSFSRADILACAGVGGSRLDQE